MRKAMFGAAAVTTVAGIVIACGGSGGGGDLNQPSASSSSGATSSSGGSSGLTSSSSSSGGPSGIYVAAQPGEGKALCDGMYGKLAAVFDKCCSATDKQVQEYGFAVGLYTLVTQTCSPLLENSIAKGRLERDAAAAAACLAAYDKIFSGACSTGPFGISPDVANDPDIKAGADACKKAIRGVVKEGGACSQDVDCVDGLTCVGWTQTGDAGTDGVCKQPPALTEACGAGPTEAGFTIDLNFNAHTHPECAPGGWCSGRTCQEQADPGESCSTDKQCKGGKLCRVGVCGDLGDADQGGPCKKNDDCKNELYCAGVVNNQPGTCQPKLPDGSACTSTVNACRGRCERPDGSTEGTCKSFCGSG